MKWLPRMADFTDSMSIKPETESASTQGNVSQFLIDRFRCSADVADFVVRPGLSHHSGYFRLGSDIICYGQCSSGAPAKCPTEPLPDASEYVVTTGSSVHLPFDPMQVVNNLHRERYVGSTTNGGLRLAKKVCQRAYYAMRPAMPFSVRKQLQKLYFRDGSRICHPTWPVDGTVENIFEHLLVLSMKASQLTRIPFIWFWPEGIRSCVVLTHDVETRAGVDFCRQLMDLNDSFAIKTSFQLVPEKRYPIPQHLLDNIRDRGFELNVHDLNHDGLLFADRERFLRRAEQINDYVRHFRAIGFRAAIMYRNVDWLHALDVSYDMSIPNLAHMDPQQGGCCTVMPFFVDKILELPLTTTQDYTLFHMFNDYSIRLWKEQIFLIQQKHGLISFNVHPDYIIEQRAREVYTQLLNHLAKMRSHGETWIALPHEVDAWWRMRAK